MKMKPKSSMQLRKLAFSILIVFLMVTSLFTFASGANQPSSNSSENNSPVMMSHSHQPVNAALGAVNPNSLYSSEPAPMGIADFGIGPGNTPYMYNTTSFLGKIDIGSISVVNNTTQSTSLSFQLNINFKLQNAGTTFVYWVQDVLTFNTTTHDIYIIDNIWNMSSGTANIHNSTLAGNGTVASASMTKFYYDLANASLPGSFGSIKIPSTIQLRMNSTVNKTGVPELSFQYNDGYAWQTYDNVNFTFAGNNSYDSGFVVDGYNYNPSGRFYDAELILGGPGGGSYSTDLSSNVSLQLQYWNGNNYQEISNAYNFGSDTAEAMNNVVSAGFYSSANGSLFEKITSGAGNLGQVYSSSLVSSLEMFAPINGGTISINGHNTSFTGSKVNLTLWPGNYSVKLYTDGLLYYSTAANVSSGQNLVLHANEYLVDVNENGLPSGTMWWTNLSHGSHSSVSHNISFYLPNGTYYFNITSDDSSFLPNLTNSSFTVSGSRLTVYVGFSPVLYNVTLRESSLPPGTRWTVTLGNISYNSTNGSIIIMLINGTYDFTVHNLTDYYTLNYSYALTVKGSNLSDVVLFFQYAEIKGTVFPVGASVTINGNPVPLHNGTFSFFAKPGNYSIEVTLSGYSPYAKNLSLKNGQNVSLSINLTKSAPPRSKLQGLEVLGGLAALLAVAGIGAVIVRRR